MLVERKLFIGENVLQALFVQAAGRKPLGEILFLNRDDCALVSSRSNFTRWLIGDGSK